MRESAILTCDTGAFAGYVAALAPLGLRDVISMPVAQAFVKEVAPASEDDRARFAAAVAGIEGYGAVVVAGPHAALALVAALGERRTLPPVWAMGSAAAAALAGTGIIARTAEGGDAAARAAAVLAGAGAGMRILMPKAEANRGFPDRSRDPGGEEQAFDALVAAGATIDAVSAYRLRAPGAQADREILHGLTAIDRSGPGLIGLFSALEVVALERIITTRGGLSLRTIHALIAIDAGTAAAIVAGGGRVAAVAAAPTAEGFADAVRRTVVRPPTIRQPPAGTRGSVAIAESEPAAGPGPASSDPQGVIDRARASLRVFLREGRRPDDLHAAIRIWKGLAPLMPGSVEPYEALGDLYCELRLFPEAKASLLIVAEKCEADRDLHGAEMALLRILGFDPVDLRTRSKLAALYALQGRSDEVAGQHLAIAQYLAAAGHGTESIQVLERGQTASLGALWDSESGRITPDLDRLLAAGRAARLEGVRGVEEHLAQWLARHNTPSGVDTASCFLTGYWPGQHDFNLALVDTLTEALERPNFPPGVWASIVVALCCPFAALDAPRQSRIRKGCAAVEPHIRDGRGWAVTAALDTIAR